MPEHIPTDQIPPPAAVRSATRAPAPTASRRRANGTRLAQVGLVANAGLAAVKLVAGVAGNSSALVADAVESAADVVSSIIVLGGLRIAAREADDNYPFGYGRAEPLAAAAVSLMLVAAAVGIAVHAVGAIREPQGPPAAFTLGVLAGVIGLKQWLFVRQRRAGEAEGSLAVLADAWHHRSDAITSGAAFLGISLALLGGPRWAVADGYAALVASLVIAANGGAMLRASMADLMDRRPNTALLQRIEAAARSVAEVCDIEQLKVRRVGTSCFIDLHVQSDPALSLHDAHIVSGRVKTAIRVAIPSAAGVLIHMEPYEPLAP